MNIIVTGGAGFVGRHLIHELATAWPNAHIVSWDRVDQAPSGSDEARLVDITDPQTYRDGLTAQHPDWVVHLAAMASVPAALEQPELTSEINVNATQALLETITSSAPDTRVLFASSADIYGLAAKRFEGEPIPELDLDQAAPANPYAQSKYDAEGIIERNYQERTICVRPFPHIGPGQGRGFVAADFASQIAAIEAGKQEPVMHVGDLEAARDFTDVRDTVRAYRLLMEAQAQGVYNVASGQAHTIQSILDTLLSHSTIDIEVRRDPDRMRPAEIPVLTGDASKLREKTGWSPEIPLEQSLEDVLTYWRRQI